VVRRGRYVHADETGQPILDKDQCHRGWMWVMLSRQAVVYHYSDSRDAATADALLGGTSGNLTIDGYAGYNGLSDKTASRLRSGCWGHCRRKFFEAMPADGTDHENRELLAMITDLYRIEDEAHSLGIEDSPQHLELRQRKSAPIVKKIWRWVDARNGKHSPKSKMGAALTYATKQRDKLGQFLHDPKLPLDNNVAERALRIVALGRKNSLFAGSAEHAQNLAIIQSIVATCRVHAVNPYDYIRHMLIEIQSHPAARIAELMPWRWHPSGALRSAPRSRRSSRLRTWGRRSTIRRGRICAPTSNSIRGRRLNGYAALDGGAGVSSAGVSSAGGPRRWGP